MSNVPKNMPCILYAIRDAKQKKQPIILERTGTTLDAITLELNS
jgi:hypothetical protein